MIRDFIGKTGLSRIFGSFTTKHTKIILPHQSEKNRPDSEKRQTKREDFLDLIPTGEVGAELGVFKGEFSQQLLKACRPKKLYLIDAWWELYGKYYPDWGEYTNFGKLKTRDAYELARVVSSRYKLETEVEFCIGDDLKILSEMPDAHLDWVYVDSSHGYQHTVDELELLVKKVKPWGLITGHDWRPDPEHEHHGVFRAVNEFCEREDWEITALDSYGQWCIKNKHARRSS